MTFWSAARRHIVSWSINSLNLFLFVITFGFLTVHEGHFYRYSKKWSNWNLYFSVKPKQFFQPTSEREISKIVESATRVRVVAGGHSFNPANLSPDTLINLDLFNNVIQFDKDVGIITVQAGIRLNAFSKIVEAAGYALPVMGTAHTQSIGGLVASDLHATGRESGYLSQQIESLKIINSKGIAEVFNDKSDVFKAALGGIGAMGVVVEVTIRLVKKFLVKRVTQYVDRTEAEEALERLLQRHQHVGFFYVGGLGAKKIRLTTYDEAHDYETRTRFFYLKNNLAQIFDMINGGFMIDFARFLPGFVQTGFFLWNSSFLGQPFIGHPGEVFTSSLFFRHDEMEYAMPIENFRKTITSIMSYLDTVQQTSLLEVRFCVKNAQSKALLGPGAGRESCFIEILPTLTNDTRRVFASTENFFAANGGRPHLGKYTTYQTPDMRKNFGNEAVERFLKARERQDPEQKFVNAFVHQVFLTEAQSNPTRPLY